MSACSRYVPTPVHQLQEHQMCVPDLYTFIKLYGSDKQVADMTSLSAFRREHLVPIYRSVRRNPQRLRRFFGRTDLPPLPVSENITIGPVPRRSYRLHVVKLKDSKINIPRKTTSCSTYTHSRHDAIDEQDMCHPDLYAYIKVFGTDPQREELVRLQSKTRRVHLLPLYRKVLRNYLNSNENTEGPRFTNTNNMRRYLNKGMHDLDTFRDRLTNNEQRWYNQLTYVFTIDDAQSVIDALERGDMSLNEVYAAREEMTRTQRNRFDQMIVSLLRYKQFQRKDTMKLFVKLGKFTNANRVDRLFTTQEQKWYQEIKALDK